MGTTLGPCTRIHVGGDASAMPEHGFCDPAIDVLVSEVGPRDGLQSIARAMPTVAKSRWIAALAAAGLREIEVGSFVSPKILPQMADCGEVVREAVAIPGLTVLALAPNQKGAQLAFAAGAHKVTMP